jgi:hypothetical protein
VRQSILSLVQRYTKILRGELPRDRSFIEVERARSKVTTYIEHKAYIF